MEKRSLQSRIFVFGAVFVSLVAIMTGISFYFIVSHAIEEQIGERALSIAVTTAERPDIVAGFQSENPTVVLQPIAIVHSVKNRSGICGYWG